MPSARMSVAEALRMVSRLGNVDINFDTTLTELQRQVTLTAGKLTIAESMLALARDRPLEIEVAPSGELFVIVVVPRLSRVVVTATSDAERRFKEQPASGTLSYDVRELASAPGFFGNDVLRTARLLPGLDARNDYSAALNVRGGESDQTLVMLDGIPIYHPFHMGGVFGTFIDAAVGRLDVYSGAFPAAYNGRLSALIDVRSAEEPRQGVHGTTDVSLLSSSASIGGTTSSSTSWLLAGRRTYADQAARLAHQTLPYHFQDANLHVTHLLPGGSRLAVTGYAGADVLSYGVNRDSADVSWGNMALGLSWSDTRRAAPAPFSFVHGDSIALVQRAFVSTFDADVDVHQHELDVHSHMHDARINGALTVYSALGEQSAGYELGSQQLGYSMLVPANTVENFIPVGRSSDAIHSASGWYSGTWKLSPSLLVQGGGRLDLVEGVSAPMLSPRASAKLLLNPTFALTASIGRHVQWQHSALREEAPLRIVDFWLGTSATPPASAWVYSLGLERWPSPWRQLRVEGFHKQYRGLAVRNPLDDPLLTGDEVSTETGRSSGIDVLFRQLEHNGFSGWISYTFGVSQRTTAEGVSYAPSQDRRHDLNLVGSWRTTRYRIGARLGVASGTPYTGLEGLYKRLRFDPVTNEWGEEVTGGGTQFLPGAHDALRYPLSHRLDLSIARIGVNGSARTTPYFSIANVYGAFSPALYLFDYDGREQQRVGVSNFRFLPTFGIRHVF